MRGGVKRGMAPALLGIMLAETIEPLIHELNKPTKSDVVGQMLPPNTVEHQTWLFQRLFLALQNRQI